MKKRLISYLRSFYLAKRPLINRMFISLVDFPLIRRVYRYAYFNLIRRKASQNLTLINLETYNVCNLRCKMCTYSNMTRKKVLMSMDLFKKIIDDSVANNVKEVSLNFICEPLLDPLLFERIKYAKSKGLTVTFNSNGCLLTEEKIDALLDTGLDSVWFSLDAITKETYEKIRIGGDFEKAKNNIIKLIEKRNQKGIEKPSITVSFVTQKDNYQEISKFKSFWKECADNVHIGWINPMGKEGVSNAELELKGSRYLYPCRPIFHEMTVMSNGKVVLCCVDYDGSIVLGDLNEQTISEIWNSDKIKKIREVHISGHGDEIKLCRDTKCRILYKDGAYVWWQEL